MVRLATEPFLFFYMVAVGANLALLPQLLISKLCLKKYSRQVCISLSNSTFKTEENVIYSQAALWNVAIILSTFVPSIFAILPVGAVFNLLTKKKKMLFLPPFTLFIQSIVYLCSAKFAAAPISILPLAASLTVGYGDFEGAVMMAFCYMACVTDVNQARTTRMVILEGMIYIGQGAGSYTSGILLQSFGFAVAFCVPLSASLANMAYVACLLPEIEITAKEKPENQEAKNRETVKEACLKFIKTVQQAFRDIKEFTIKYFNIAKGNHVKLLILAALFTNSAVIGEDTLITLFIKHSPLNLNPEETGLYLFILNLTRGFGVVALALISSWLFHPLDHVVILIGLISLIASHISISLSTRKDVLFGVTVVSIAFPFAMSGIRALLTKLVSKSEHGVALSSVGIISLVGASIMTPAAYSVFTATAKVFPGFSFLILTFSSLIAAIIILIQFHLFKKKEIEIERSRLLIDSTEKELTNTAELDSLLQNELESD